MSYVYIKLASGRRARGTPSEAHCAALARRVRGGIAKATEEAQQ
jgi:hypothetical protein